MNTPSLWQLCKKLRWRYRVPITPGNRGNLPSKRILRASPLVPKITTDLQWPLRYNSIPERCYQLKFGTFLSGRDFCFPLFNMHVFRNIIVDFVAFIERVREQKPVSGHYENGASIPPLWQPLAVTQHFRWASGACLQLNLSVRALYGTGTISWNCPGTSAFRYVQEVPGTVYISRHVSHRWMRVHRCSRPPETELLVNFSGASDSKVSARTRTHMHAHMHDGPHKKAEPGPS